MICLESRVNLMHKVVRVADETHHDLSGNALFLASGNKSNTSRVETNMSQFNSPEETPKLLPGHQGHLKSPIFSISYHLAKERNQLGTQGEVSENVLMPFGAQSKDAPLEIDLSGDMQTSLTKPTALLPRDNVGHAHPLRLMLQRGKDALMLSVRYARLFGSRVWSDAEPFAWITRGKAALHGLIHDYSKQLQFVQCGVLTALIAAGLYMTVLTPIHEVSYKLPAELPRHSDLVDAQEGRNIAPDATIPSESPRSVTIPLLEKPIYPRAPRLARRVKVHSLGHRRITAQSVRLASFKRNGVSKFCAPLAALPANVGVFNPVKGRIVPLVKGSHIVRKNLAWLHRKSSSQRRES